MMPSANIVTATFGTTEISGNELFVQSGISRTNSEEISHASAKIRRSRTTRAPLHLSGKMRAYETRARIMSGIETPGCRYIRQTSRSDGLRDRRVL
jgi:hypothetical protein